MKTVVTVREATPWYVIPFQNRKEGKLLLSSLIAVFEMGTFLLKIVSYEGTC